MATDYLKRIYWPKRSEEEIRLASEKTVYDRTIGRTARMGKLERMQMSVSEQSDEQPLTSYAPRGQQNKISLNLIHGGRVFPSCEQPDGTSPQVHRETRQMSPIPLPRHSAKGFSGTFQADARNFYKKIQQNNDYRTAFSDQLNEDDKSWLRQGRGGGVWRHVKEVMQSKGQRIVFVDGITSIDDRMRNATQLYDRRLTSAGRLMSAPAALDSIIDSRVPLSLQEYKGLEGPNWRVMR